MLDITSINMLGLRQVFCSAGYCQGPTGSGSVDSGAATNYIESTAVTPPGADQPIYRASQKTCPYNSYTDTTGCSCIIYVDSYNDFYAACVDSGNNAAFYWVDRDTCLARSDLEGENVPQINKAGNVDSTTGNQYCSGTYSGNDFEDQSVLSMPGNAVVSSASTSEAPNSTTSPGVKSTSTQQATISTSISSAASSQETNAVTTTPADTTITQAVPTQNSGSSTSVPRRRRLVVGLLVLSSGIMLSL